ncbi:MAG: hypothetical protein AAF725_17735 [Acidobacteriota bacterium]
MREPRTTAAAGGLLLGLLLVTGLGCGKRTVILPDAEVLSLFEALHRPVYGVYDLGPDRDRIHDLLAESFDGEALTEQYVEHFTTLTRMGLEETAIRVVRVDYESLDVAAKGEGQASVEADWSVGGVVSHQEHRHLRTNRYRALYDLEETARGWRIVATHLRDLHRVRTGFDLNSAELPKSAGGLMSPLDMLRAGLGEELPDDDPEPPPPETLEPGDG